MTMEIKILQYNTQRGLTVHDDLRRQLIDDDYDIILTQEPYLTPNRRPMTIRGYRSITGGDRPSTVIYIKDKYEPFLLAHVSDNDWTAITVHLDGQDLGLVSGYCRGTTGHDIGPDLVKMDAILGALQGRRAIFALDANSKSRTWHSRQTDERGHELDTLIVRENLVVLNQPSDMTTFMDTRGQGDNIDLTLITDHLDGLVHSWTVNEWGISDHRPLSFSLHSQVTKDIAEPEKKLILRKAHWGRIRAQLRNKRPLSGFDATELSTEIMVAIKRWTPRMEDRKPDVTWWDQDLERERNLLTTVTKDLRRNRTDETLRDYRQTRNRYIAMKRRKKKESWMKFVTESGSRNPFGFATRLARGKIKQSTILKTLDGPNGPTENVQDTADRLISTLFPLDDEGQDNDTHRHMRLQASLPSIGPDVPYFTEDEIDTVIKTMAKKKAPGVDGVTAEMVLKVWPEIRLDYLAIANRALDRGSFPDAWKVGLLKLIPKASGDDPALVRGYRPLTLLPILGKMYEKLILTKLEDFLNDNFYSDRQYGFLKGKSTTDFLVDVKYHVRARNEKYVVGVALDIKGAFDRAWWPAILNRFRETRCPRNIHCLLTDYFRNRTVKFDGQGYTVQHRLTKGCPQGSVLGPYLWNALINNLLVADLGTDVTTFAYADDVLLLVPGNSRRQIEERGNTALRLITQWTDSVKLELAVDKTKAILLKGHLDEERPPRLFVQDNRIAFSDSIIVLGVKIDAGLRFNGHVTFATDRARLAFAKMARLHRRAFGYDSKTMTVLYKSIFEGILCYAAPAWAEALRNIRNRRKVLSGQRTALTSLTGAYRTTSSDALPVVAGVFPGHLLVQLREDLYENKRQPADVRRLTITEIKTLWTQRWQDEWEATPSAAWTHHFFPDVNDRLKRTYIKIDHFNVQLLTGHGDFRQKLHHLGLTQGPECLDCGQLDTVSHAIFECEVVDRDVDVLRTWLREKGIQDIDRMESLVSAGDVFARVSTHVREILRAREEIQWRY